MDPGIDSEWLTCKNEPAEETQQVGNVVRAWQWREQGLDPPHYPTNKNVLENVAEDILVQKPLKIRCCDLPGYPRSTFLMVFSPDGTKVASTHGNHNVYVSELASGKHVRILKGHPRTPWCIAFHPSHTQLIGSGCLGGQVRVWDISSGGSEVWTVRNETVIASIAFHPREQLLVIATYNELYFWDWSRPAPYMRVSTNNVNEKVRYVAFDALGYKLITGISLWANAGLTGGASILQHNSNPTNQNTTRRDEDDSPDNRSQDNGTAQDMIVNSYQNLVQRYDSLVRNYQRLFMVRHRLTNTSPPPTTDRGTDPMETDVSPGPSGVIRRATVATAPAPVPAPDDGEPGPSTSRAQDQDGGDSGDAESSSRLLNLDVLSIDGNTERHLDLPQIHSIFGSRSSAFQPLSEGRTFRTVDQNERSTRLLPNPFSSTGGPMRNNRSFLSANNDSTDNSANTSRTSIFTSFRPGTTIGRAFLEHRRNSSPSRAQNITRTPNTSVADNPDPSRVASTEASTQSTPRQSPRPTMTNSSTQMSPLSASVDAQTINESLDLIRDILRDSGTRLLNLITNMSLSNLANMDRNATRRGSGGRTQSDDSESGSRSRGPRPRMRLMSPRRLRAHLLSSSSDSDSSDQSLEVNIFRTRNTTFEEDLLTMERLTRPQTPPEQSATPAQPATPVQTAEPVQSTAPPLQINPNGRMTFEIAEPRTETTSQETGSIHVTVEPTNSRFHVRSQNTPANEEAGPSTRNEPETPEARPETSGNGPQNATDSPRPSTSRDNFWEGGSNVSPEEAFRKVKAGVAALQKHTTILYNHWLRGDRTTMRELRTLWENLRRRVLTLHRETGRQDLPSHYTRSLLERCMMLTDMGENLVRPPMRGSRNRVETSDRNTEDNRDASNSADTSNTSNTTTNESERDVNTSTENGSENRSSTPDRPSQARPSTRSSPSLRRILQPGHRWRMMEDDLRRRARNPTSNRPRLRLNWSRRDLARVIEISATRHEIRMRAMQVLSVMLNMMMMCLEERGLSQIIITMLRTLKKALALTCLMLMMNRNPARNGNGSGSPSQRLEDPLSAVVVRIQNDEHSDPVNVDGPDEPSPAAHPAPGPSGTESNLPAKKKAKTENTPKSSTSQSVSTETDHSMIQDSPPTPSAPQRWSNRLAVQIAAANRNTSAKARTRRDLYLERRRQKALHRTNPAAHPIAKKKALPPVSGSGIPALRYLPSRLRIGRLVTPRSEAPGEPVAGPSNAGNSPADQEPRDEMLNEFEHRVNLIRIAHLQAVRLRNAARTRFRRLQTIRLYTPSSVREMFELQNNADNNATTPRSPTQNGQEAGNRRLFSNFAMYHRPHILTPRNETGNRQNDEPGHFHAVLNNVAMPLMQVNELPATAENSVQPNRLPRIHEYLQPIILAQNAMVVDDDNNENGNASNGGGGGVRRISAGMAGLLDAGIIPDPLPAPSHRVQAWDFTTGETPDIGNSTKNVVVQRCRIHNDASIDISKDGRLLVALLPVPRLRNTNHWLGVYSLEWARLGQCLHTAVLEQSAVSVALSPTARHLAVGLGSRRFTSTPHARNNVFALLYRLEPLESSSRTGLSPIKELEQNWEQGFTSLNCLRWAPQPGQGLVYANNTGQLIIMS